MMMGRNAYMQYVTVWDRIYAAEIKLILNKTLHLHEWGSRRFKFIQKILPKYLQVLKKTLCLDY